MAGGCEGAIRMRDGYLRGELSRPATQRQVDVLAAYVAAGGSVQDAAELLGQNVPSGAVGTLGTKDHGSRATRRTPKACTGTATTTTG